MPMEFINQNILLISIVVISGLDRATIASMGLPEDIPVFSKPVRFAELRKTVEQFLRNVAAA